MKKILASVLLLVLFASAGCASRAPDLTVQMIQTALAQTQTAGPSVQPRSVRPTPTLTQSPTSSATATSRPTIDAATNVATVIADPEPDFSQAYIYGVAHLGNGHFLVTLEIPESAGNLQDKYYALLGEDALRCIILAEYPDRLYCNGPTENAGKFVSLQVINRITEEIVFESEIGVPPSPYLANLEPKATKKATDGDDSDGASSTPSPTDTDLPPYPNP